MMVGIPLMHMSDCHRGTLILCSIDGDGCPARLVATQCASRTRMDGNEFLLADWHFSSLDILWAVGYGRLGKAVDCEPARGPYHTTPGAL